MDQLRRKSIRPIDRWAGVAPQFFRDGGGYLYRRDGFGAPVRVTADERDGFVRRGLWSLVLHAVALVLATWAALLAAERLHSAGSDVARAAIVAVVASIVGLALYRSHRWYVDEAARALAGRPAVGPAGEVDVTRWPSYGSIAGTVAVACIGAALHYSSTAASIVALSTAAILVGLAVAAMKWWFESGFTPVQRQRASERRAAVRTHEETKAEPGKTFVLILFLLVEMAVLLAAFMLVMGTAIELSGTPWDDPAPLPYIGGMIAGFAAAGLAIWPIEALCKRLTGKSALDEFNGFPF